MATTNQKVTFTTYEDIQNLLTTLNEKGKHDTIPQVIVDGLKEYNNNQRQATAKTLLTSKATANDLYKSLILVDISTDSKHLVNDMFNAISFDSVVITLTDTNLLEAKQTKTALLFKDFYKAKLELLATSHADGKPKKEDRQKANDFFFSNYGYGLLQCLTYKMATSQSLDGITLKKSVDLIKAYKMVKDKYTSIKKSNPFDATSNTAKSEQLKAVYNQFIGDTFDKKVNKYHYDGIAQIVATTSRKAVFTIASIEDTMQALILVGRYIHNGKQFVINDKAKISK